METTVNFWWGQGWCGEFSDSVFDFKYTKYLETVSQILNPSNSVGDVSEVLNVLNSLLVNEIERGYSAS